MRKELFKIALSAIIFLSSALFTYAQIGPVVSISQKSDSLPQTILTFLNSYYPGATPLDIELKTMENIYKIKLSNNTFTKFDSKTGQWLEIEAPDKSNISQVIVYDLLPGEIYNYLKRKNLIYKVSEMKVSPKHGYKIKTNSGHYIYFDLNGNKTRKARNK